MRVILVVATVAQQIEELYHSAREYGVAVLDGIDREIRKEVEKLLSHASGNGNKLLDQNAAELMNELAQGPITPGTRIGPYKIEAELGPGGMGRVFQNQSQG